MEMEMEEEIMRERKTWALKKKKRGRFCENGGMLINKTGIKPEQRTGEDSEEMNKRGWREAQTEEGSDCCNDCLVIVRSGFQLDFVQL